MASSWSWEVSQSVARSVTRTHISHTKIQIQIQKQTKYFSKHSQWCVTNTHIQILGKDIPPILKQNPRIYQISLSKYPTFTIILCYWQFDKFDELKYISLFLAEPYLNHTHLASLKTIRPIQMNWNMFCIDVACNYSTRHVPTMPFVQFRCIEICFALGVIISRRAVPQSCKMSIFYADENLSPKFYSRNV